MLNLLVLFLTELCVSATGFVAWYQTLPGVSITTSRGAFSSSVVDTYSRNGTSLKLAACKGSSGRQPCYQETLVRLSLPKISQTSAVPVPYNL